MIIFAVNRPRSRMKTKATMLMPVTRRNIRSRRLIL